MQFDKNTGVYASDGSLAGKVDRVVVDPTSDKVSHIVVRKGLIFTEDKVIPIEAVAQATREYVNLKPSVKLDKLPKFEERHYIPYRDLYPDRKDEHLLPQSLMWYPMTGTSDSGYPLMMDFPPQQGAISITRNIPSESIALEEGASVVDSAGKKVGSVGRIFVNDSDEITHFVITQGLLFHDEKLIPVEWVSLEEEDKIHLRVSADLVKNLPEFEKTS